jgi:hypothetical protein
MGTLQDFYRHAVAMNDSMHAGWASYYYGVFSKVINDNQYTRVAEVGIGYGTHAKYVLKTTNVDMLYLIDPMQYYPNDAFVEDIMTRTPIVPENQFNEMYDLICEELKPWSVRYTWFRVPSLSITNDQIPEGYLDCVFVDGDHSYEAVKKDLAFWWAKIRVGGQMLGDDYWIPDVARAVHEFATENKVPLEFLSAEGKNYLIFSFKKTDV